MRDLTPELVRGLARSSPWRWRALSFDLHRRPLHGPDHTLHATLERGVGLDVRLAEGDRHRDAAVRSSAAWITNDGRTGDCELPFMWELPVELDTHGFVRNRPHRPTSDDPMWQDYQFVAMLDPVELAEGMPHEPGPAVDAEATGPPALDIHRLDATLRHGRETWWAEAVPSAEYSPRCSCCPLLFGRVSEEIEAACGGGPTMLERQPDLVYASAYLIALDVETGVCVHVEHLDGTHVGRGFSLDIRSVDAGSVAHSDTRPA